LSKLPNGELSFDLRNRNLRDVGQRLMELTLEDHFDEDYCKTNVRGPVPGHKGADYVLSALSPQVAIEVKFWTLASRGNMNRGDYVEKIRNRFVDYLQEVKRFLFFMGHRPKNWPTIVEWSRHDKIQPFLIPFDVLKEGEELEMRLNFKTNYSEFDPRAYAQALYPKLRPLLLISLEMAIDNPFKSPSEKELNAMTALISRGYYSTKRREQGEALSSLLYLINTNGGVRDFPQGNVSGKTAFRWIRRWRQDGRWEKMLDALGRWRFETGSVKYETANGVL
jgi:hypothetical protein